jgi:hypothetical protein
MSNEQPNLNQQYDRIKQVLSGLLTNCNEDIDTIDPDEIDRLIDWAFVHRLRIHGEDDHAFIDKLGVMDMLVAADLQPVIMYLIDNGLLQVREPVV